MVKTPEEIMIDNSKLFAEKKAEHGSHSYLQYEGVINALFPIGFTIGGDAHRDINQFGIINMMIHKMIRICNSFAENKHDIDSVRDIGCYAAMLQSIQCSDVLEKRNM